MDRRPWVLWGSELSPFALKLALCLRAAGLPHRVLPAQGGWLENHRYGARVEALKRGWRRIDWPVLTDDDELPLVPYLLGPDGEDLYDSTAIAEWLDRRAPGPPLIPADPLAAFVVRLVDDYADEFLLYVVHHQRWVTSARDNDAGARMAREHRHVFGPFQGAAARWFAARQTRRLPYLFSVAPAGFHVDGLPPARQPPSRPGFPPTHALLEAAHARLLAILEALLQDRPFVCGERFTLADAALYGQLGMNLSDPTTDANMRATSPRVHGWLQQLHTATPARVEAPLRVDAGMVALLAEIARTHVPLMQQNDAAYTRWRTPLALEGEGQGGRVSAGSVCGDRVASGRTLSPNPSPSRARGAKPRFNERAFDAHASLYDGVLDGQPFRHVAKSFQAQTWRRCRERWAQLPGDAQRRLAELMPSAPAAFA